MEVGWDTLVLILLLVVIGMLITQRRTLPASKVVASVVEVPAPPLTIDQYIAQKYGETI